MDFFIKKIFEGNVDGDVHNQFNKFSRGEFKNRAMIVAKKSKDKFNLSTTAEYARGLVRALADKLGGGKTDVKGVVVSTRDLTGELDFQDKKQFMGVKQYIIDREMSGEEILDLCDKLSGSFVGLSFSVGDSELKIKPKAPKSAKPSTKGDQPKVDFCKLKTFNKDVAEGLLFDIPLDFKKVEINHEFIIDEIVISDELKEEAGGDFSKIKDLALRKGKIVRRIVIDEGEEEVREKDFEA